MTRFSALLSRLGVRKSPPNITGHIDGIFSGSIQGWAYGDSAIPLSLVIQKNGILLGRCVANQFRADLKQQGIRDGRCGFSLQLLKDPDIRPGDFVEMINPVATDQKLVLRVTKKVFNKTLGSVELVTKDRVAGWIYLPWQPKRNPAVEVRLSGRAIASGTTNRAQASRAGNSRCNFDIKVDPGCDLLAKHAALSIYCVESGQYIPIPEPVNTLATTTGSGTAPRDIPIVSGQGINPAHMGADNPLEAHQIEIRQLRDAITHYQTEIELNRLQLRQVQDELERWFAQYQDLDCKYRSLTDRNPDN